MDAMIPAAGTKMCPVAWMPSINSLPRPFSLSRMAAKAPRTAQNMMT